jgi:hypothetical protein
MKFRLGMTVICLAGLSACVETQSNYVTNLPEEIVAMAAPNQDLTTVQLREEDGCYWYRHVGPVETTMLPLRSREGRPICTRPQA